MYTVLDTTGEPTPKLTEADVVDLDSVALMYDRIYRDLDNQSPREIDHRVQGIAALARALNASFVVINPPSFIRALLEEALVAQGIVPLYTDYSFCMDGELILLGYLLGEGLPEPYATGVLGNEYAQWKDAYSSKLDEATHQRIGDLWPIYLRHVVRGLTRL